MIRPVAEQNEDRDAARSARMRRAIVRGIAVGVPICVVGLTLAIWMLTDLGLMDSFVAAVLPGAGLGGFAGGFAGIAATSD
ncbi:MAG: hypothetical protein ACRDVL_02665 [Acidimicrobiia bacterium]